MVTTYRDSGVDIEAGERAVELIRKRAEKTFRHYSGEVLLGIGGFGAAVLRPDGSVLGTATDGVGTKLLVASLMGKHDTVGIDLVAMCVNDLAVAGIKPELFLDYIAMGKQMPERTATIVGGIIDGCEQASMTLIGGEMAEMPGMYSPEHYDLAGFAVGFAESRGVLITGENIKSGMRVYGFPSSGVHSNGYSLIRRVFGIDPRNSWKAKRALNCIYPELDGRTLGEELLTPTVIYVKLIRDLCARHDIAGMVHITGGGLVDNPPRVMPDGCAVQLDLKRMREFEWIPSVFRLIQRKGNIADMEMLRTFNMGFGMLVVTPDNLKDYEEFLVGKVVAAETKKTQFVGL